MDRYFVGTHIIILLSFLFIFGYSLRLDKQRILTFYRNLTSQSFARVQKHRWLCCITCKELPWFICSFSFIYFSLYLHMQTYVVCVFRHRFLQNLTRQWAESCHIRCNHAQLFCARGTVVYIFSQKPERCHFSQAYIVVLSKQQWIFWLVCSFFFLFTYPSISYLGLHVLIFLGFLFKPNIFLVKYLSWGFDI